MFAALGRFIWRFKWLTIGVWLALFVVSVIALPFLGDALKGGFANPEAPSQEAARLIQEKFQQGATSVLLVFHSDSWEATSPEFQAAEKAALDQLQAAAIPHLESIQTYATTGSELFLSKDRHSSVAVLSFDAALETVQDEIGAIREAVRGGPLQVLVTGEPAVNADLTTQSFKDLQKVELYGLPVALIALLFVFGSLASAALPVITGGLAVTVTLGGMYLLGQLTEMSIFAMNTATLLGLAVAIDYALFFVSRFREELHQGASVEEAVVTTTAQAGRSLVYSGVAVMVGVAGLFFFPSPGLRSIGAGGVLVVFFSVAASVTFMPALIAVLGKRVNSLALIPIRNFATSRFWNGWTRTVLRKPWISIIGALVLAALLIAPAFTMKTEMTTASTLPATVESRAGIDLLDTQFDREALSPISVLVTWGGDGKLDLSRAAALFMYGQQLAGLEGVASVTSPFTIPGLGISGLGDMAALASLWPQVEQFLADPTGFAVPPEGMTLGGVHITAQQLEQLRQLVASSVTDGAVLYRVVAQAPPGSSEAQDLVGKIVNMSLPGYEIHVAGEAAYNYDFYQELSTWFPWVIVWVFVTGFFILVALLRSLLLPAVAVVMSALTIGMSWGCVVLLFQGETMASVLRVTSTGAIDVIIPVVLLCVLFGITTDYAVFMLTRTHESFNRTGDNRSSVELGLVQTGRIITSAALLVVIVTGAFVFTSIRVTKMLGVGIALAVIADALLTRLTLLPAVMTYLGRANWWFPRRSARRATRSRGGTN